ncbi:tetratricopeptide repeat protein [Aeromonas caviae]|uniref:tetratricopeptide repeat protein n=1 Tax=Aeromonas caviae TaxID=648 RepID=UPI003F7468B4
MKQLNTLKAEGRIEEARQHGLLQLIAYPAHAELHYEVAGLHDMLGREAEAIPLYQKAVSLGLGEALSRFPDAVEFKVFRAMTCYNLGRSKEGMETLLGILATTTTDPALLPYRRAMALYAEDLDRRW